MIFYNNGLEALLVGFTAAFFAQAIKFFQHLITKRKVDLRLLATTGGMPSSHSAGVIGLATIIGLIAGFDSLEFAVAFGFACVVMYDAAGVRRAAGKQAACLNRILEDFYKHDMNQLGGKLKELLGHTPLQVFLGAVFGFVYAYYMHIYCLKRWFFPELF
ncbi:divergent PAP2 family protein [bacterium]|nr:divergent PAP2 family protein [bacterium]